MVGVGVAAMAVGYGGGSDGGGGGSGGAEVIVAAAVKVAAAVAAMGAAVVAAAVAATATVVVVAGYVTQDCNRLTQFCLVGTKIFDLWGGKVFHAYFKKFLTYQNRI